MNAHGCAFLFALLCSLSAALISHAQKQPLSTLSALGPSSVPPIASYTLTARLDPKARTVRGSGRIHFKNPSQKQTKSLYFHLYLNAFESDKTLFQRGTGSRSGNRHGAPGSIEIHSLKSPSLKNVDLWPHDAHSPSDKQDRTDIMVPLPRPLAGGEAIELDVQFTAHLPQIVERTGYERDFFLVAQWFPKLAKREPDGRWAHFAFHPHGEFYADFGNYDVTLEVPEGYVVGSTGQLKELRTAEPRMRRFRAQAVGVHDFAWTAWPDFEKKDRNFGDVAVTLLHPPHSPHVAKKTLKTLERGLVHLGAAYGSYPHPTLTAVQPPSWASRAGGMEYPQFITTGGNELSSYFGLRDVELLTIHELAHQWFQGTIASNEMAHPFLDEGLTSYAESRYLNETYGPGSLLDLSWIKISRTAGSRYINLRYPGDVPIATAADEFESFSSLGSLVYARSALCLETLGRVYSFESLHRALRAYAIEQRFRHPSPQDLFRAISEQMGSEAAEQAKIMFLKTSTIDFQIGEVRTEEKPGKFASHVKVNRVGSIELPALLLARFADGTIETRRLRGRPKTHDLTFHHTAQLKSVEVDPARQILVDENFENNRVYGSAGGPRRDRMFHSALAFLSWALAAGGP